jgi:hypothetical protein
VRIRSKLLHFLNVVLGPTGFELRRYRNYIAIKDTIKKARKYGKTVTEYLEEQWDVRGSRDLIIRRLDSLGVHAPCNEVVEIGPGTGVFLEEHMRKIIPLKYHIYETARDSRNYLAKTYNVVIHPADGSTLSGLPDKSCGLSVAHGVFVYLSFLTCFKYFEEMARVCQNNGFIVFDIYSDLAWELEYISSWLKTGARHPVILPEKKVIDFFARLHCDLIGRFMTENPFYNSTYLIFRKRTYE